MADQIIIGNVRGRDGQRGATGATPNIDVAIVGLPAGSDPTISKSGNVDNPTITFGIPALDQGYTVGFTTDKSTVSTVADFASTYALMQERANIRFFLDITEDDAYYELGYSLDETNEKASFFVKSSSLAVSFDWDANGLSNFIYMTNAVSNLGYTVITTF